MSKLVNALGITGLVTAGVGAFMIHYGFGIFILGFYAVVTAKMMLEAAEVKAIKDQVKDQLGELGNMFDR